MGILPPIPFTNKEMTNLTNSPTPTGAGTSRVSPLHMQGFTISKYTEDVIIAGSLAVDLSCDFLPQTSGLALPQNYTSNPASIRQSLGGVGQNIASALHYCGAAVRLCTNIADDIAGSVVLEMLAKRGLSTTGVQTVSNGTGTGQYVAVNDAEKNLVLAMADMDVLQKGEHGGFDKLWQPHIEACRPKWLVVDANWDSLTLQSWILKAKASGARVAFEPVSGAKAKRIFPENFQLHASLSVVPDHIIDLATPNALELGSMHSAASAAGCFEQEDWRRSIDNLGLTSSGSRDKFISLTNHVLVEEGVPQQSIKLLPFIPCILTTLGENGVLMTQMLRPGDDRLTSPASAPYILSRSINANGTVGGVYMRLFAPPEVVLGREIVSVNGVGDTFIGVLIAGLSKRDPRNVEELIDTAQRGSIMTLKSMEAVNPSISSLRSEL